MIHVLGGVEKMILGVIPRAMQTPQHERCIALEPKEKKITTSNKLT